MDLMIIKQAMKWDVMQFCGDRWFKEPDHAICNGHRLTNIHLNAAQKILAN